jgi:hypothetical protein
LCRFERVSKLLSGLANYYVTCCYKVLYET